MPLSATNNPAAQLASEIEATQQLLELLKQEQERLVEADIEALAALTESKTKAVSRMSELALARHRSLQAAGFPASEVGMQQWLASASPAAPDAASWSQLLALVKSTKELNHTNGILINTHLSRNQAALNILHQNTQDNSLYGPNGQATGKSIGRGIVAG